jgi:hypothetical protein
MAENADDPEKPEYVVRVRWDKHLPIEQAFWEKRMFANQLTPASYATNSPSKG